MIETPARIAFLNKIHLFQGLGEDVLATIADQLVEESPYVKGNVIYEQGKKLLSLNKYMQFLHNGVLPTYLVCVLLGIAWLLFALAR